ncbi:hypothetical protein IFM89_032180 [Coptis chinensis]|uniref:VAN3-binding protein-like auxin canalisation domain-containing protein n=1 Tax=Coptis chinensis TaxID=261450 RepID=A0A835IZN2_9MAGN|nr:hypothetical protein IFM89_032180 [Coptis chinensis]
MVNTRRASSIGKWFHNKEFRNNNNNKVKKKERARVDNARVHAALRVAGVAAALAVTENSNNSKMRAAMASATEVLASHFLEIVESASADHDRVAYVAVFSAVSLLACLPLGELFFFHMILIREGITTYEYVVAMRAMSEAPGGASVDEMPTLDYSPWWSTTTGLSGGSSLGLQYKGEWIFAAAMDLLCMFFAVGGVVLWVPRCLVVVVSLLPSIFGCTLAALWVLICHLVPAAAMDLLVPAGVAASALGV